MHRLTSLAVLCALFAVALVGAEEKRQGSVVYRNGEYIFKPVFDLSAVAYGTFLPTLNSTGWDVLHIKAGQTAQNEDLIVMRAAGVLEAHLTADRITMMYNNNAEKFDQTKQWLRDNDEWVRKLTENCTDKSKEVRALCYVVAQLDGLREGYHAKGGNPDVLLYLNAFGSVGDIINSIALQKDEDVDLKNSYTHCSALVKMLPGLENIFMAHSTWAPYSYTSRIYKHYDFVLKDRDLASGKMSFSSYPGNLASVDDFYMLANTNLVILSTTNNVNNKNLIKWLSYESILTWQRVRVANMLARDGKEWAEIFKQYNSGTYNNQYTIVDLKKIQLKVKVEDWALTIVEQIPTLVKYSDQTAILRTGYWPSYNVPFDEKIYAMSGFANNISEYQMDARAKIFRRDVGKVADMKTMKAQMRYNEFQTDPYSKGNSCNSICCRMDSKRFGCYDSKITDYNKFFKLEADIISGPTIGHGQFPVFRWPKGTKPEGLPAVYNFGWHTEKPEW